MTAQQRPDQRHTPAPRADAAGPRSNPTRQGPGSRGGPPPGPNAARRQWNELGLATSRARIKSRSTDIVLGERAAQLGRQRQLDGQRRQVELELRGVAEPVAAPPAPNLRLELGAGTLGFLSGVTAGLVLNLHDMVTITTLSLLGTALPVVSAIIARLIQRDARRPTWLDPVKAAAASALICAAAATAAVAVVMITRGDMGGLRWLLAGAAILTVTLGVAFAAWLGTETLARRGRALQAEAEKDRLRDVLTGKLEVLNQQIARLDGEGAITRRLAQETAEALLSSQDQESR